MSVSVSLHDKRISTKTGPQRWKVWLELGRVSNLPTVWTNVLAAIVLSGQPLSVLETQWWISVLSLLLAMSLAYTGGMFLNDAFDRAFDAQQRPDRPIPSGRISEHVVFLTGFAMLIACVAIVFLIADNTAAVFCAFMLSVFIVAYNAWHKTNQFSALLMGLCRVSVYLCCTLSISHSLSTAVIIAALISLFYIIGLTATSKHSDTKTGDKSRPATRKRAWPKAFLASPLVLLMLIDELSVLSLLSASALILWAVFLVRRFTANRQSSPIAQLIAGISLVDGLLIAVLAGELLSLSILPILACGLTCGVAYLMTLSWQKHIAGT